MWGPVPVADALPNLALVSVTENEALQNGICTFAFLSSKKKKKKKNLVFSCLVGLYAWIHPLFETAHISKAAGAVSAQTQPITQGMDLNFIC